MVKAKKKLNPDKVKVKPRKDAKSNPFEVKINRQKHQVMNRKMKAERGLPGVSRDRAIAKRKETLLKEYLERNKDNSMVDRRIGEGDCTLDDDQKIALRLARESKMRSKKNIFNLNDEEVLTHMGQSVLDIDGTDDPRSDDEDMYDKLGADFVKNAHFGGFMNKVERGEESRKSAIDQLIAESKRLKHERQQENDQNIELTDKLDSQWRDIHSLLSSSRAPKEAVDNKPDSYDKLVRELQYAPRAGAASDRTKTEEEIQKEERERLEALELERMRRARGEEAEKKEMEKKRKHVSADDLDDGFQLKSDNEEDNQEESEDEKEGTGSGEENEGEENDDEDGDEDDEEDEESEAESYGDLESDSGAEEEGDVDEKEVEKPKKKKKEKAVKAKKESVEDGKDKIGSDIPYIIKVPEDMDTYDGMVEERPAEEEWVIIERILKSNAPSLHEKNKSKLEKFLQLLIDRIYNLLDEESITADTLRRIDGIIPHIYKLCEMSPVAAARSFQTVVKNIYNGIKSSSSKKAVDFPGLEQLIVFKIMSSCFSVSDLKHMAGTPALICMNHMLCACKLSDSTNMVRGLFVANLVLEYVAFAGKYVPEVTAFILRFLKESLRLVVTSKVKETQLKLRMSDMYSNGADTDNVQKCRIIFGLLNLVKLASSVFGKLPSYTEIFHNISVELKKIDISKYPEQLKDLLHAVTGELDRKISRNPMCRQKKKPQMLKMYEPLIEERVDMLRKVHDNKDPKAETKKLQNKYKKELKSAMREIRRDNQFIAQHKLKEQIRMDEDRRAKVKRLFGDLTTQQGEFNALEKIKKKKK